MSGIAKVFVAFFVNVESCELLTETQNGCKIENGQCVCSFGCKSEFRYSTKRECSDALKGRSNDSCSRTPCLNYGTCIQISQMPGYKCRCEGTGYWGNRCQRSCPKDNSAGNYPYECVVI
ncbi:unnamed protein product [Diamesa tonsa]